MEVKCASSFFCVLFDIFVLERRHIDELASAEILMIDSFCVYPKHLAQIRRTFHEIRPSQLFHVFFYGRCFLE